MRLASGRPPDSDLDARTRERMALQ
jgi:hypothetical protein